MDDLDKGKESNPADGYVYRFGEFALDSRKRTLSRAESPVSLTAKAFDVLLFLAQHPNRLVTKEELLQAVWGDTFVEEGNLAQYISHLRKALGDVSEDARLIVTIARKGYQFTADVTVTKAADSAKQAAVHVSTAERSLADAQPGLERPPDEAVPKAPKHWQKAAVVGTSVVLLVIVSFTAWRHSASMTPSRSQKIMLAVLPFQNLTGDPDKEYLADGLTEETISLLGRLNPEQLGVIARTSVMGYKHKDERLDQIGRDLSVQYVLENSFRESGDHIRLTAQLIQVKDQTHLWSQDYDYSLKDILNIEDDVAKALAHEIRVRLTPQQRAEFEQSRPVNPEAFDAYLQGYYFFQRHTDKDRGMAAEYYKRATQLDPSYALAWAGLSGVLEWQASRGIIPAEEGNQLAREAVERALALNPNLATAHTQLGRIKQRVDFDWAGADASFQRAIDVEPENLESVRMAATSAALRGRFDEALRLDRRAVELDPLSGDSWQRLAETEFFMAQLDEAAAHAQKALELSPDVYPGRILLSEIYVIQGRPQNALTEIESAHYEPLRAFPQAIAYYALHREKESDAALSELIANPANAYQIAEVYAFRNQSDNAFEWLDRAYVQRSGSLSGMKVDPLMKSLRRDPRYAALLKKLNLPN
jgi:TolB-like protein/DNA-binding winged helix-turn-helix (wHTH) protein/Flp pilus assembly protein TadD